MKRVLVLILLVFLTGCRGSEPAVEPETYTLTLRGEGGTPITQVIEVEVGKQIPDCTIPSRPGYVFEGYYSTKYLVDDTRIWFHWEGYAIKLETIKDSPAYAEIDRTLYAHWHKK